MIKAYIFDLSRTLLFPKDINYKEELNKLYREIGNTPDFIFSDHFYLDEEILGYLEKFKANCELYIFTSGSIQNAPEIKPRLDTIFKKIYSAEEMGLSKKNPNAYKELSKVLGIRPQELVYIDDSDVNVQAAKLGDLNAELFTDFLTLKNDLQKYLPSK